MNGAPKIASFMDELVAKVEATQTYTPFDRSQMDGHIWSVLHAGVEISDYLTLGDAGLVLVALRGEYRDEAFSIDLSVSLS